MTPTVHASRVPRREEPAMKELVASDVMNTQVLAVRPDITVRELATLLTENEISGAPVTDGHGRLLGTRARHHDADGLHRSRRHARVPPGADDDCRARSPPPGRPRPEGRRDRDQPGSAQAARGRWDVPPPGIPHGKACPREAQAPECGHRATAKPRAARSRLRRRADSTRSGCAPPISPIVGNTFNRFALTVSRRRSHQGRRATSMMSFRP